jgi:hypothetical protein
MDSLIRIRTNTAGQVKKCNYVGTKAFIKMHVDPCGSGKTTPYESVIGDKKRYLNNSRMLDLSEMNRALDQSFVASD